MSEDRDREEIRKQMARDDAAEELANMRAARCTCGVLDWILGYDKECPIHGDNR